MISINNNFDNVIEKYGNYILLVRHDKKVKCTCWNNQYQAPTKSCKKCLGTGYIFKAEKFKARSMGAAIPETLPRALKDSELGEVIISSRMFYLSRNVEPDIQDYIIECEWDQFNRPVFGKYSGVYEINYAEPFRGDNGNVEFFRVACKYDPIQISGFKAYLAAKQKTIVYNVSLGGL